MKKVTAYMDDKGNLHATKILCEQANAFDEAIDLVEDHIHTDMRADEIINMIQNDKKSRGIFRRLIDSSESLDKVGYEPAAQEFAPVEENSEEAV